MKVKLLFEIKGRILNTLFVQVQCTNQSIKVFKTDFKNVLHHTSGVGGPQWSVCEKRQNEALYSPNCMQMHYFGPCAMFTLDIRKNEKKIFDFFPFLGIKIRVI